MKSFILSAFITVIFAASALAQVPAATKIGLINTAMFYDDKLGITKLVNANKQLNTEFGVQIKALEDGTVKLQGIAKELETMRGLPRAQFNQVSFNTKQDEGERLQRELNYKKTELESAITRRRDVLVTPISRDIAKAIDEFGLKNGYGAILDVSKLDEVGAILYLLPAADLTKDFVTFYNSRTAAPATTTTPK